MKLMVLGRPILPEQSAYRGTYREQPFHFDDLPEDHEANRAFRLFMDSTVEGGPISDLNTALSVLRAYQSHAPERRFELVEATEYGEPAIISKDLMGFDISSGFYYSLIAAVVAHVSKECRTDRYLPGIYVLDKLLREHFRTKLNHCALFEHSECARKCLDAMMALQKVQPNLYENPDVKFEVVGLHTITTPSPSC